MAHTYKDFDWYESPLYYDILFDKESRLEGDFLEAMYERHVSGGKRRVLEPACGSGRLVAELARRGYRVKGFDISKGAVTVARERLARERRRCRERGRGFVARVSEGRMEAFHYRQRFDLAHCLVSTFKFLLSEKDAHAHLRCVADALEVGGIYVLGFHLSDYDDNTRARERWLGERDGISVVCNTQTWPADRRRRRERMRTRLVVERDGEISRYEVRWRFRTYDARQFRALLAKVPQFVHVETFDFDCDPDRPCEFGGKRLDTIVVLKRR